jgi:Holliday junction resolvase RusA-like endonuclease
MKMAKNRKQKAEEYKKKYGSIPLDYKERIEYLIDLYNLENKPAKMQEIIDKRNVMMASLFYYDLQIVSLYEEPEGTGRPRFRIVNRKNFHNEAMANGQFVHVYTIGAKDDFLYMRRLVNDELIPLEGLINTPVDIEYHCYFKTPSYFNITDTFLAEMGLIRPSLAKPDWDNIGKKYCDMYNHNVWLDDATVNDATVRKFYSILPRVEIRLRYLNSLYNKQQYNRVIDRTNYDGSYVPYMNNKGEII